MKDRITNLLQSKAIEYYPWPKTLVRPDLYFFNSLLVDPYIFSQLALLVYSSEFKEGEIDKLCKENLKDENFTTFVLFLNGVWSHFDSTKFYLPRYSVLWELLKDFDTRVRETTIVEPQKDLKQELQQSVVMLSRSYKDLSWVLNVLQSVGE